MATQQKNDDQNCKQQQQQQRQEHLVLPIDLHQEVLNWIPQPANSDVDVFEMREQRLRGNSNFTEEENNKSRLQKISKALKLLLPHLTLLVMLIGYLCAGACILQALESRTELEARSRKLIRLGNLIENFTVQSWEQLQNVAKGQGQMANSREQWAAMIREHMISVVQEVEDDDNRKGLIRREMLAPERLDNIHNNWTFPTAQQLAIIVYKNTLRLSVLYVLTVLTTCGYSEVSVQTNAGKLFSVAFALVGIPLMFMTAKEMGKFLSDAISILFKLWKNVLRRVKKRFPQRLDDQRRHNSNRQQQSLEMADNLDVDSVMEMVNENIEYEQIISLWFFVLCICFYFSFFSLLFTCWQDQWSFLHAFHFGFNLITIGLGNFVVTDYMLLSLIVAFAIVGLAVGIMCVELASDYLNRYLRKIMNQSQYCW